MRAMKRVYLYCLDFLNGKKYVGLTNDPIKRFRSHVFFAKTGNLPVHCAIRKHGCPQLRVLCAGDKAYIAALEVAVIAALRTRESKFGYNVSLGGELSPSLVPEIAARAGITKRGRRFSAEHRAKIGRANAGRTPTPETREKLRAASKGNSNMVGRSLSAETRAKISAANKGRPRPHKGRAPSAETRAKMRAAKMGNTYAKGIIRTPEERLKNSIAHKGKKPSAEARARMRAAQMGRKHSPETIAKMRATYVRRWHLKRQLQTSSKTSDHDTDASHSDRST